MAEPPRLLVQVRDRIRARHLSFRTEKTYLYWIRRFIRFHKLRHPRELGGPEVEEFLTSLAVDNKVSAATQNQALAGVLFLYRGVLELDLPWLTSVVRAKRPQHLPVVLTRAEVQRVLANLQGTEWLIASMLYGAGMRVVECLQLRVKDLEPSRREIVLRDGKGQKDRVTILPDLLIPHLRDHLARIRVLHEADRHEKRPGVSLPYALRRKYPYAATSWMWQWDFPAQTQTPWKSARPTQLGNRSDWLVVSGEWSGAISLAADGSLWLWRAEEIYDQQTFLPLLRPTRRPQLIGNIFSKAE